VVHGTIGCVTRELPAIPAATHGCVRCGAPVALDVGLCERCNPLGLKDSSASQVHGIAIAAIALAVVLLAVIGRLALSGLGPFSVEVANVASEPTGLAVELRVTNAGSAAGQVTCRVSVANDRSGLPPAFVLTPRIEAGRQLDFTAHLSQFGSDVRPLAADCGS
jgi:hypothetical protein